jgi:hypothetical protein
VLDGADLIDVIRRQIPAAPPGIALLTVEALRIETERLELRILHAARQAGLSWGQIAASRGVSRGTVEGRYRTLSGRWPRVLEEPPGPVR